MIYSLIIIMKSHWWRIPAIKGRTSIRWNKVLRFARFNLQHAENNNFGWIFFLQFPSNSILRWHVYTSHFIIQLVVFLVITLASVLCALPAKGVSSIVKKFERAASKETGPKSQIPDAFQVIKNGKPVNGNFVSQRSKVTGKVQWEKCKNPLF